MLTQSRLFTQTELESASELVHRYVPATAQYAWPTLAQRLGMEVWVKHENHTPTGAFKVRGGVTLVDWLRKSHPNITGLVTATRGNHGQSLARAARLAGLSAKIIVPHGNSVEKNTAMRAFGAELVVHGQDFDEAREEAQRLAEVHDLFFVPPYHTELVRGVSSYAMELFNAVTDIDTVYVPIGCGSGICSVIAVRDALQLGTKVVGVVSANAMCAKLSYERGELVSTNSANTFADGVAVRIPVKEAFDIYSAGAARIVSVTDEEVAEAIRVYFHDTHNLAEGAGAAPLAALMQEREQQQGKRVAVILCGGNIDTALFSKILAGDTPSP